jgi:hypothetical protein
VQQGQRACVRLLARLLPAAASLSAEQMMQLLRYSVQKDDSRMTATLCEVQSQYDVAQSLKPHQVEQLLTAAIQHGKSLESVAPLCKLPEAMALPTACIEHMIKTAEKALEDIRRQVDRERDAEADKCSGKMMKSTAYNHFGAGYSAKKAADVLSPSQVARQMVAAVTVAGPRVQLAMRVVAALKELQAAARMHGK